MSSLSGKSALVTGASAGIGRATALAFAQAGAKIIATGRRKSELEALAKEGDGAIVTLAGDLNDKGFVDELASKARDVDIMVNNAGILKYAPLMDMTDQDCEDMSQTNGPWLLAASGCDNLQQPNSRYMIDLTSNSVAY
jgi:NADP-dependent 3-hydroxy acid dehydrogenase YdfG